MKILMMRLEKWMAMKILIKKCGEMKMTKTMIKTWIQVDGNEDLDKEMWGDENDK